MTRASRTQPTISSSALKCHMRAGSGKSPHSIKMRGAVQILLSNHQNHGAGIRSKMHRRMAEICCRASIFSEERQSRVAMLKRQRSISNRGIVASLFRCRARNRRAKVSYILARRQNDMPCHSLFAAATITWSIKWCARHHYFGHASLALKWEWP